ncbi:phosphate transport system regulatory protein PhoU [Candidatus Desantisbacteria bacterium CG_4_10_14_0_8_um_filter_39_17]|uniref:Phosphate-specific transport system accessory protein PhoU n=1 Tax=Candidatus Desantisbacteria bacterium CG_4_10_14_0_8_um_filter_39_17 TaxID=1974542 RepID=A0A2H9PAB0_9BACT|nr:MAG: phosphate transport system regulatory protein PhoU [Candidatus Desantisbacteria bacterium CG_4_10_14_0_8_um_filter_39_17]
MERHFDEELKNLKEKLLYMAGLAETMISDSVKALVEQKEDIIDQVYKNEDEINLLQVEIDDRTIKMIALHQPAAVDLRFLVTAIKINSELERMGDQAINICQATKELLKQPLLKPLIDIPRMAEIAGQMVKDSLDAFVQQDPKLAKSVCVRDDEVDDLKDQVFRELLTYMMSDPGTIQRAMDLILISRHLERIADHATNIGEEVIFMVQGKDIRHHITEK